MYQSYRVLCGGEVIGFGWRLFIDGKSVKGRYSPSPTDDESKPHTSTHREFGEEFATETQAEDWVETQIGPLCLVN